MNVDAAEIAQFEILAPHWWDKNGECRPLHDLNPIRLQFITDHCVLRNKSVLDIGCGGGILTESLHNRGAIVTGIDACEALIEVAKLHAAENIDKTTDEDTENCKAQAKSPPISYEAVTAENFSETHPAQFDIVTCMELLEHVPDPLSLISACAKLLKPEGQVFFSTLNRTIKAYALAILGAEYVLNLLPKGTHHYEKFIQPSELNKWLLTSGLELKNLAGLHYNPITKNARLNTNVSVNYLAYAIRS